MSFLKKNYRYLFHQKPLGDVEHQQALAAYHRKTMTERDAQ